MICYTGVTEKAQKIGNTDALIFLKFSFLLWRRISMYKILFPFDLFNQPHRLDHATLMYLYVWFLSVLLESWNIVLVPPVATWIC